MQPDFIRLKQCIILFVLIHTSILYAATSSLPAYNVNINTTTVSGLSSGGFMAVQMHIAYSNNIIGAGVFAGGPYNCAEGSVSKAEIICMNASPAPNPNTYVDITKSRANSGAIDPPSNLANDRVYLFSGTEDDTVHQPVMDALQQYYLNFIDDEAIVYVNNINAAHTQPTNYQINSNPCDVSQNPYLSYCDYDGAGNALKQLFNNSLNPLNTGVLSGKVIEFDQSEFHSNPNSIGLANNGYAYVPASCADGNACFLHVSFHGCLQDYGTVGYDYINNAGFNQWADTNNIIVLYPQTLSTFSHPTNPNACWDWWGYNNNPNTYDTKSGIQMQTIYSMIQRITSGYIYLDAPMNLRVLNTTDNSISLSWSSVFGASGYFVYRNQILITSQPINSTYYIDNDLTTGTTYLYNVAATTSDGYPGQLSASVSATTTGAPPPLAAPSSLLASSVTSSTITLIWNSVSGATQYNIYRNSNAVGLSNTATFTDTGLTPSTSYTYTVTAQNSANTSPSSSPLIVSTSSEFSCTSYTANNYDHVQQGRAYEKLGITYANGSGQDMGLYNIFIITVLSETSPNYYIIGSCPN